MKKTGIIVSLLFMSVMTFGCYTDAPDAVSAQDEFQNYEGEPERGLFTKSLSELNFFSFGSGNKNDYALKSLLAPDGGMFIAGYSDGSFDGQGSTNGEYLPFITRRAADGSSVWTRFFNGSLAEAVTYGKVQDMVLAADGNLYLCGYIETESGSSTFITSYNVNGQSRWFKVIGNQSAITSIAADSLSNIYVAINVSVELLGEVDHVKVAKFDSAGNASWTTEFGTDAYASGIAVAVDGSIYVTGYTCADMDGQSHSSSASGYPQDVFLKKLASNGSAQWTKLLGDKYDDQSFGIVTDSANNVYVAYTNVKPATLTVYGGTISAHYLVSFKANGTQNWSKNWATEPWYNLNYNICPSSLAIDSANNLYIGGTQGSSHNELFIQKYTSAGSGQFYKMANDRGVYNNQLGDGFDLIVDETNAGQTKFHYAGMIYAYESGNYISTLDLCVLTVKAQ